MNKLSKKDKYKIYKILLTIVLLLLMLFFLEPHLSKTMRFISYLIIYFIISTEIISKSVRNISKGEIFDENFLMLIASVGAFFIGQYSEGIAVILLYQVGELFEDIAVSKSKKSINQLLTLDQDYANIIGDNGQITQVAPDSVEVGSTIIVKNGERVPIDGILIDEITEMDNSALTGESIPQSIQKGDNILSGAINLGNQIKIQTTIKYQNSTMKKMLQLVQNAEDKKSNSEEFITKFAKYYTPFVIFAALLVFIIPNLFTEFSEWQTWLYRSLIFLVVSCPCALVISIPLSFFAGIGGLSKNGILVKGNKYIEQLSHLGTAVFDKTGTLTSGLFSVTNIETTMNQQQFLQIVASLEQYSTHPIAKSIVDSYKGEFIEISDVKEITGYGMSGVYQGQELIVGNDKLMTDKQILLPKVDSIGTIIYVAIDNQYVGYLEIKDPVKPQAKKMLEELQNYHINRYMLTGDNQKIAKKVSEELQLDGYQSQMLPTDKVKAVEEYIENTKPKTTLFVGDGMNDAPVIARADIGCSMGITGSDLAIETSDMVIVDDKIEKISLAVNKSKKIMRIVKTNIAFALIIKFGFLILATLGLTNMEGAIFADVGVTIIAILNAIRALKL